MASFSRLGSSLLVLAAGLLAAVTFYDFESFPLRPQPLRPYIETVLLGYLGLHILLWIPALLLAWRRDRSTLLFLSLRLGLFATFVTITLPVMAASRPESGPVGAVMLALAALLLVVLATDVLVWLIALWRRQPFRALGVSSAGTLFGALMLGWISGVTLWSERLPNRILTDAAGHAAGRAYCVMAGLDAATTARDLTAWAIWWRRGQASPDMHAVLVMDDDAGSRTYANWSFWAGRFLPLEPAALNALEPEQYACRPQFGFGEDLS